MRRLLLLGFVISAPCYAVPVIPNFTLEDIEWFISAKAADGKNRSNANSFFI